MDPVQSVGELIEQGQNSTANTVKAGVTDVKKTVQDQVGLKNETSSQASTSVQNQAQQPQESLQVSSDNNDRTKEVVRDFYSPSDDNMQQPTPQKQEQLDTDQRLSQVRQRLYQEQHNEVYYQPLISYEHNQQRVESTSEKLENEKRQEMQDLQVKQANSPPPLAVTRAQTSTEINRGIAG
jgi:hypothetical protein